MSKQELLLVVLTIGIWIATLKRPFYGVAYFYLYYALEYNKIFDSLRSIRPLFITPVIVLVSTMLFQRRKFVLAPQVIFLVIFFLWMCLSRLMNGYDVWAGEEIDSFFKIVIFVFIVTNFIDTKENFKFFIWIMIIAYADLAVVARYYDMTSPYYFMNRNHFGFHLVGAIAFPAIIALKEVRYLRKLEAICYVMIILLAVAGTDSRGAYLGIATIFVLLILSDFNIKKLILIAIPIILILTRISVQHWERFGTISVDTDQGGTGGQRLALWSNAIRMMFANPLFGIGSGEAGGMFSKYATPEEMAHIGGDALIKVHNMTLQIGAEMGVVGLALFTLIVLLGMRDIWQARRLCKQNAKLRDLRYLVDGLGIAMAGLLITGQFGNYGYRLQFYVLYCLAYCIKSIVLKEQKNILKGLSTDEIPVIPVKWEVPSRVLMFSVFTFMNLKL